MNRIRGNGRFLVLGGMLTVVAALLGWLLGLAQSAGHGRRVADRLRGGPAPGRDFRAVLPNFDPWIDAYAVLAIAILLLWAAYVAGRVLHRTRTQAQSVLADQPAEPGPGTRFGPGGSTSEERQSRARVAARWRILAGPVDRAPVMLAAGRADAGA